MSRNRAFTMIELLMVMLIIGIVMAIVVPALGGARQAARRASTQAVMGEVTSAASSFRLDHSRMPGMYSVDEMGRATNINYGLTAMENAMLELVGGVIEAPGLGGGGGQNQGTFKLEIPGTDREVWVDPAQARGNYFVPDPSYYKPMITGQQVGDGPQIGDADADPQLLDVVDAWGNPLLLWAEDEFGPSKILDTLDFARESSGAGEATARARFYWASNAGFLRSESLGKGGKNQNEPFDGSLLQEDKNANDRAETMMAIFGHPSFPDNRDQNANSILATAPRGSLIIHSAGQDGFYFGKRDRGSRAIGTTDGGPMYYGYNFKVGDGDVDLIDDKGQVDTLDRTALFDDMLLPGGN